MTDPREELRERCPSCHLLTCHTKGAGRCIETAGPELAQLVFGWDTPMWRYRNPFGPWHQGEPPAILARLAAPAGPQEGPTP